MILPDFNFGLMTYTSMNWSHMDALVGLAYPNIAYKETIPFFDRLIQSNELEENIFAFYFSLNPYLDTSELILGSYN